MNPKYHGLIKLEEVVILGTILYPEYYGYVSERLNMEWLGESNKTVWQAVGNARQKHGTLNLAIVWAELELTGKQLLLHQVTKKADDFDIPSGELLKVYLRALKDKKIHEQKQEILKGGKAMSVFDIQEKLKSLDEQLPEEYNFETEVYDELSNIKKQVGTVSEFRFGISELDRYIGLDRGYQLIIGGATSSGKTVLGLTLSRRMARDLRRILIISVEMSDRDLVRRLMQMESGVSTFPPQVRKLEENDLEELEKGCFDLVKKHFVLTDKAFTLSRIRQAIVDAAPDVVVVDYLQLLSVESKQGDNRARAVGECARQLKLMARQYNVLMVILSQLRRTEKKPTMQDLRESGEIENHADIVLLLHRENKKKTSEGYLPTTLILAKNRYGQTRQVAVEFCPNRLLFQESNKDEWRKS